MTCHRQPRIVHIAIWVLLVVLFPRPSTGQAQADARSTWAPQAGWDVALVAAYPEVVALDASIFVGATRTTRAGRTDHFRGAEIGAVAGLGAVAARVSFADYAATHMGRAGWSIDAVAVRPWVLDWGMARGASYVGGGLSVRAIFSRLSVALLVAPKERDRRMRPRVAYTFDLLPWPW